MTSTTHPVPPHAVLSPTAPSGVSPVASGDDPFVRQRAEGTDRANPPNHMYGGCSVQHFDPGTGAGDLFHTHEDAGGWLGYVGQFDSPNFYFQDGNVQVWEYNQYDDWQDYYGVDAVRAFYHSGHGGMDANGVFFAPLGGAWSGEDWARSDQMNAGDEYLRYLFWSTCFSCEMLDGQDPIRTWGASNRGLRMLFGFQSTSVDSGDYGRNFWSEWNSGKSLSQAWQDASLAITANQQPSSFACGATQHEAADRLFNERLLYAEQVSRAWYWWRWAGNAPGASRPHLNLPARQRRADLAPSRLGVDAVTELLARYSIDARPSELPTGTTRAMVLTGRGGRLALRPDGGHEVTFAEPDRTSGAAARPAAELRAVTDQALAAYGLTSAELAFDRVQHTFQAGGTDEGSGTRVEPSVAESTVLYRQLIDGVPVVSRHAGQMRVSVDPSGTVTRIADSRREVGELHERLHAPRVLVSGDGSPIVSPRASEPGDVERVLRDAWQRQLRQLSAGGPLPDRSSPVPGSTEVGYSVRGDAAVLVARREVEAVTGAFTKRHLVEVVLAQ